MKFPAYSKRYIISGVQGLKCKPGCSWAMLSAAPRRRDRLEQSRSKLKTSGLQFSLAFWINLLFVGS